MMLSGKFKKQMELLLLKETIINYKKKKVLCDTGSVPLFRGGGCLLCNYQWMNCTKLARINKWVK